MSRPLVIAVVASVLLVSLVLRWPLASHDVEHYAGPDEGEVVENVLEMLRMGDFDHRHRGYPGLHFYLQMAPLALHRAFEGRPIPELPRSGFYLTARRVTLLAGIAAALVVYFIGRRFLPPDAAGLGSALVAVSPLGTRESAVVNPDLMLSLFVAGSLLSCLRLVRHRRARDFVIAGASLGLAAGVKYTGAFTLVPYLVASAAPIFQTPSVAPAEVKRIAYGLLAAAFVFALVSPYTWLYWEVTLSGLGTHTSYYNARSAGANGALELLAILGSRGLGPLAALAAAFGAMLVVVRRNRHGLVLLSFPLAYLLVFALFGRAFPRHALVLLVPTALLAGVSFELFVPKGASWLGRGAAATLLVGLPLWGSIDLARRALRPTPADRAKRWAEAELPPDSRIVADQFTPSLGPEAASSHRIGVEERVFLGNYDFAFVSGYPPGIDASGLREIQRFETRDALGDTILVYQIPPRESLMPMPLAPVAEASRDVGAGELPYFGEGWHSPGAGAFETSRLSSGTSSEIFVPLSRGPELEEEARALDLEIALTLAPAVARSRVAVTFELNGRDAGRANVGPSEREVVSFRAERAQLVEGLNRLVIHYEKTERLDRRRPRTAIRLYRAAFTWRSRDRLR